MRRLEHRPSTLAAAAVVGAVAVAMSVAPLRSVIEQSMLWHMVVQMPLLALAGWLAMAAASAPQGRGRLSAWNRYGLTGFIAALMVFAYWMLPLTIDRAVVLPAVDVMKLVSLLAAGALLRHSFDRAPMVLQLFFVGSAVPMAIWLGVYFASTDLRLCNAYSLQSQIDAGRGIAGLGVVLGAGWLLGALRGTLGSQRLDGG